MVTLPTDSPTTKERVLAAMNDSAALDIFVPAYVYHVLDRTGKTIEHFKNLELCELFFKLQTMLLQNSFIENTFLREQK